MKIYKRILCLFCVIIFSALTIFPVFAKEDSMLTLICTTTFDTDDYDVVFVQLLNTDTNKTYSKRLFSYNNFCDKFLVEDGNYIIVDASMENRSDTIYKVESKSFTVSGNTITSFVINDSGLANKHTISTTTTTTTTKETDKSVIVYVKTEEDIQKVVDMVKDKNRVNVDKINKKITIDVHELNAQDREYLYEILTGLDYVDNASFIDNEDLKTSKVETTQSVVANTSEVSKSEQTKQTTTQQQNSEQHEKPWYIKHWYLAVALIFLLLMISIAIFVVHQRKKYSEE